MKRILLWLGGILGALTFVVALGMVWTFYSIFKAIDPVESVDQYPKVLAEWKPSGLVDHFPDAVPDQARQVRFSALPGFLQGGAHIQIRMELPEDDVKSLYEVASKKAWQQQDGGSFVTLINERKEGLASTSPHTFDKSTHEFPQDYRIFIFYAKPYHRNGSVFDWNHGESKGMVISLQRNEVIYFAEDW